jgi:hypothetical protein
MHENGEVETKIFGIYIDKVLLADNCWGKVEFWDCLDSIALDLRNICCDIDLDL